MSLSILVLNGFFLGTANVLPPMYITLVTNVVNVAADYALIFGHWGAPALGVRGAAWAALLANAVGLAIGLTVLVKRYGSYLREPMEHLLNWVRLRHQLTTHANLLGRTLCLLGAQFCLLGMVSRMGEVALAAHAIIWQIWALVSYAVDGFAHAAETLVGNSLGAGEFAAARSICRRILLWGIAIGCGFSVVFALGIPSLAALFTEHPEVVAAILPLTFIVACAQPMNAAVFVLDGIFIGANDVAYLFRAMIVAAAAFFVPAAVALVVWIDAGLTGAWLAYLGLMVGRLLTLWRRYRADEWLRSFATNTRVD